MNSIKRKDYGQFFEYWDRWDGTKFARFKDNSPQDLHNLINSINLEIDSFHSNWVYEVIWSAFNELEDNDIDNVQINGDCYPGQLIDWLQNESCAISMCDEARGELGQPEGIIAIIEQGQWYAKKMIYDAVDEFIKEDICE